MKLLLCHVSELAYEDLKRSNRPAELAGDGDEPQFGAFSGAVVAFVTVENNDGAEDAIVISREIERSARDVGERIVVLMPFAHLSNDLAKPQAARSLLQAIRSYLEEDFVVTAVSFGFHKRLRLAIDIYGHAGSVAFRSSNARK